MPFENTFDRLLYGSGDAPKCAGFRIHQAWLTEQSQPLQKIEVIQNNVDSNGKWVKWLTDVNQAVKPILPSLKVLVIRTQVLDPNGKNSPVTKYAEQLRQMFEDVQLPVAGLAAYLRNMAQFACVPSATKMKPGSCSFFFSDPSVGWTWAYDPESKSTRAILLCRDTEPNDRQEECRAILEKHTDFVDQPLMLSYLCIESMGAHACQLIGDLIIPGVLQIERSTGLETWNPGTEETLDKILHAQGEPEDLRVVLYSQRVTDIRFRLSALLDYILVARRQNQRHAEYLRTQNQLTANAIAGSTESTMTESLLRSAQLDEIMEHLHDFLKIRLLKVQSLASRISTQIVAVEKLQALKRAQENQLITRDNHRIAQDSNQLALESSRNSKGMMTIATVTMVFLPGTFLAAFFAMPVFQWDTSNIDKIVNPRIWIYWAVTVPLTFLVLGVWGLYSCVSKRKSDKENDS